MSSGLYEELTAKKLLVTHTESKTHTATGEGWKIIKPLQIPFISYSYEWPFSMLKDAALLTLEIQRIAIKHGMSMKDASAFNIQFLDGQPILIDTLSFEKYEEGKPWVAYKQFVEHFLTPLAVMSYNDIKLGRLTSVYLDGIPVEIAASILPYKARFNPRLLFHIFAHASSQKKYSDKKLEKNVTEKKFSKRALLGLLDNLEGAVRALKWSPQGTQWEDYYEETKNNYTSASAKHKAELVEKFVKETKPKKVWDMGANTGVFSNIAAKHDAQVVAFDIDYGALEKGYLSLKKNEVKNILPLFCDLTNPIGSLGWENTERLSLQERGPADLILGLALIHHLAIPHNIPFSHLASSFAKLGKNLVVEFIEKSDSQVKILLSNRKDIFTHYNKEEFEAAFKKHFTIKHAVAIKGSKRTLYLMTKKA